MKFYTSYYGNYKNIPKNLMCVQISRTCPDGLENNDNFTKVQNSILAPSDELLYNMKSGKLSETEYKRQYLVELLQNIQSKGFKNLKEYIFEIEKTYNSFQSKWDGIIFMCYESPEKFCHRHIIRNLLTKVYNIECVEYPYTKEHTSDALF